MNAASSMLLTVAVELPEARAPCPAYPPPTVYPTELTPCRIYALAGEPLGADWCSLLALSYPVKRLPIVAASRLIGNPRLEIGTGGVRFVVLVILAVIPGVTFVRLAVRGIPLVVEMET